MKVWLGILLLAVTAGIGLGVWHWSGTDPGPASGAKGLEEERPQAAQASATDRLALVIGNAAYESEAALVNTRNDAQAMAAKLKARGFRVTTATDLDRRALARTVTDFLRELRGSSGVGLVYYSGHGLQVGGKNYLLPIDARIQDELDVPNEGLPVDRILAEMGGRGAGAVNLMILDACRNNPFTRVKGLGDKGLARAQAPESTLILYAARPGETASDNPAGSYGLFTKHLLAVLDQPGVEVETAFKEVVRKVYQESRQQQYPWLEGVLLSQFYFLAPVQPAATQRPSEAEPSRWDPVQIEQTYWDLCAKNALTGYCEAYLAKFPQGHYAPLAQVRLQTLQTAAAPAKLALTSATPQERPVSAQAAEGPEMVRIEAGCFQMGSSASEKERHNVERQHQVCVDAFGIGKYEVTFDEYDKFARATGRELPEDHGWGRGRRPVIDVSWHDATAYAEWLSKETGQRYRLPMEAEWEYAARAGTRTPFWSGDCIHTDQANYEGNHDYNGCGAKTGVYRGKTLEVGSLQANSWGLSDVAGNVWEWTCSAYDEAYGGAEKECAGKTHAGLRVLRGGAWLNNPGRVRAAQRLEDSADFRYVDLGFRLAQD